MPATGNTAFLIGFIIVSSLRDIDFVVCRTAWHAPCAREPGARTNFATIGGCPATAVERYHMTFVVTAECIRCKYTDCVEVCPVDCFHEGPNFLVIDPEECIDCSLCEPECPVEAIHAEEDLKPEDEHFLELNRELSAAWPVITVQKEPPAGRGRVEGGRGQAAVSRTLR